MTSNVSKESAPSSQLSNDLESDKPTDEWINNWGFPLDQLFKAATKFFKENEGKVLHPSYDERNQFLALVLLVKHGPFDVSKASPLGALDFVGRDRRQAWTDLKDMSKEKGMSSFIQLLNTSCPSFKPYIEAHKREKEEREKQRIKEEEEEKIKKQKEEEEKIKQEESEVKRPEEYFLQEEQRRAIKEALKKQTYEQFKDYAEKQYPNDLEQQDILINKLQEQHYEQYMQQIVQQRLISDLMNGRSSTSSPPLSQNFESPLLSKEDSLSSYQSTTGYTANSPSTSSSQSGILSTSSSSGFHSSPSSTTSAYSASSNTIKTNSLSHSTFQEVSGDRSTTMISTIDEQSADHHSSQEFNQNQSSDNNKIEKAKNGDDAFDDDDDDVSGPEDYDSIESPQMWTNKDIKGFKEAIRQINGDGIIKVGHGEIVTVRVPTHPDGTCIFWEFATDTYDIGFGLFFEWTKNPGTQVSVHISESEDEDEEDEDEIIGPAMGDNVSTDPEKGSHSKCINSDEFPTSMIVPIYRRDCHDEVYAGSHSYPGKGAYHLKFDNSYSLWRSKTLYYRVYYTK
ncbi:Golgi resident protein GCP60 [Tetranychus urticae]|uniref:GOLD domain-containing protein n=1 Tax=Tetranychus urticae TaxID=32264 RepID=T1KUJ2_TETUR|nr:Golgi resident protein GCP60 [Tetranychus urticae]